MILHIFRNSTLEKKMLSKLCQRSNNFNYFGPKQQQPQIPFTNLQVKATKSTTSSSIIQSHSRRFYHHHERKSLNLIIRSYSNTSHRYHYTYPKGPGQYGSPPVESAPHTSSGHSHDHHEHHHHDHKNHQAITTTQQQQQQQQQLLHVDPSVTGWNDTVSQYDVTQLQSQHRRLRTDFRRRGYTVGIGGPVGSGKTATVLALCQTLPQLAQQMMTMSMPSSSSIDTLYQLELGVVTNDIFTQEDAEFLYRHEALADKSKDRILPVETGGCPHTAIREDISSNIAALETITKNIHNEYQHTKPDQEPNILLLCESGGDNLAANFSYELVDLTIYVIDVAGGDKVPRKGGPGISQSDLLVINKIDLAHAVQSDLHVMYRDANLMRTPKQPPTILPSTSSTTQQLPIFTKPVQPPGPTLFCAVKHNIGVLEIGQFILQHYFQSQKQRSSQPKA